MLFESYVHFHIFIQVRVTEWPPSGEIAAHSAYDVFSKHKYLSILFFPSRFLE